jgi:hypothetical protein
MAAGPVLADNGHGRGKGLFIDRDVDTFAVLPQGVTNPEGITANPANGDIYVSTFVAPIKLLRYNRHGRLLAQRDFAQPLLGLEFRNNKVYITNVGNFVGVDSKIQRVNADLTGLEDGRSCRSSPALNFAGQPGRQHRRHLRRQRQRAERAGLRQQGDTACSDLFQGAVFKTPTWPVATSPVWSIR